MFRACLDRVTPCLLQSIRSTAIPQLRPSLASNYWPLRSRFPSLPRAAPARAYLDRHGSRRSHCQNDLVPSPCVCARIRRMDTERGIYFDFSSRFPARKHRARSAAVAFNKPTRELTWRRYGEGGDGVRREAARMGKSETEGGREGGRKRVRGRCIKHKTEKGSRETDWSEARRAAYALAVHKPPPSKTAPAN